MKALTSDLIAATGFSPRRLKLTLQAMAREHRRLAKIYHELGADEVFSIKRQWIEAEGKHELWGKVCMSMARAIPMRNQQRRPGGAQ